MVATAPTEGRKVCSEDGCAKPAKSRGMCPMHYERTRRAAGYVPPRKPCAVDQCPNVVNTRGWCSAHYVRWKKTGDVQAHIPVRAANGLGEDRPDCSIERCDNPAAALNGWCKAHYERWRTTGDVQADVPFFYQTVRCEVKSCQKRSSRFGYCERHATNWENYGTPIKPFNDVCEVVDCTERAHGLYLCRHHYTRHRSQDVPPPEAHGPCSTAGCVYTALVPGWLCIMHAPYRAVCVLDGCTRWGCWRDGCCTKRHHTLHLAGLSLDEVCGHGDCVRVAAIGGRCTTHRAA